jgi:hypothetical protein
MLPVKMSYNLFHYILLGRQTGAAPLFANWIAFGLGKS